MSCVIRQPVAIGLVFMAAVLACDQTRTPSIVSPHAGIPPAATQPVHTNRLAGEKSPYLLQHAHNPVDWYPWGEEAFVRARRENKPIFLSIGYSTCHWCHVMEHESFEDAAVARLLNEHFVSVKVDREERPDLDRVYMTFVQASTGSGGWPMTVLLTPDLKPFFGGTYFPPEDSGGRAGLKTVLLKMHELWENDHDQIIQSAEKATRFLQEFATPRVSEQGAISTDTFAAAYADMRSSYDPQFGGFGSAPKFPQPVMLNFLLREYRRTGEAPARDMVLQTLYQMVQGGIRDHLGGGFHRYATDQRWFLPHFEKMLYDQAQLASVCLEAWQITHEPFYADTARDILNYVLRDLTGDAGQFYSAEDADSAPDPARSADKQEGAYYVWSTEEVAKVVGPATAPLINFRYGVEPEGNVDSDPFQEFRGKNVLYEAHSLEETAAKFEKSPEETTCILAEARHQLLAVRGRRPRPHLDDKTLTAWNGLMISTLARAGPILDEPRYSAAAVRAAAFIRAKLYNAETHTLQRRWREGQAQGSGFLDDYAFLIQGLLDLYESTLDVQWLKWALDLQARQDELFWDPEHGGYFSTIAGERNVLVRLKDSADGAEPAGNSIAVLNLLRLAQMTDDRALRDRAERALKYFSDRARQFPTSLPQMLVAAAFAHSKPLQIVLAGRPDGADTQALLHEINRHFLPAKVILAADGAAGQQFLSTRVEFMKTVRPLDGRATAYVCQNFACQQPTNDLERLRRILTEQKMP